MGQQFHFLINTGQVYCCPCLRKTLLWYFGYVLAMKSSSVDSCANSYNSGIGSMWTCGIMYKWLVKIHGIAEILVGG